MYAITNTFKAALLRGHHPTTYAAVYTRGQFARELPVTKWQVTIDEGAKVRRRCTMSLADPLAQLIPASAADPLWPKINEIRLWSGIKFRDGSEERLPLGVFRISKPKSDDATGNLDVSIDTYDRSRAVSRARLRNPYTIADGTIYPIAIRDLIKFCLPFLTDADFNFMVSGRTTPLILLSPQDDPWEQATKMADSLGAELFFDVNGKCVLRPVVDPSNMAPVMTYGGGKYKLTALSRELDDERAYNYWVMNGEGADIDPPFYSEAWDNDPLSPNYYDPNDPWAVKVPFFIAPGYAKTQAQGDEAVLAAKVRATGVIENVSWDGILNPAHEAGDVVELLRPRSRVGGLYVLSSIKMNSNGSMTADTRKRNA